MASGTTLITGATGFVGSHLVERLTGAGPLFGWHRPAGRPPAGSAGITWQAVDILDAARVRAALEEAGATRIYHLAGAPHVGTSWQTVVAHLEINALGTEHVLEAVRVLDRPCRVLVVTSAQVYQAGDEPISENTPCVPNNPYGLSKLAADDLALRAATEDGLDVAIARPFNHAGPRQSAEYVVSSFARQIARIEAGLAPPSIQVGNLEARRDLTDVRDVVSAYERLMDAAPCGRPYNICSGRAWRIADLLDELLHLSSVHVTVEIDESRLRPSDTPVIQGDATRIRTELGWAPRIKVEETLRDTLDWWRVQVRAGR
ncbi:MAG: GDP-mannose 4,6-dehydratase [Vicinamibacterales bacterium]